MVEYTDRYCAARYQVVKSMSWTRPCACGSGELREEVTDARGIFVAYVCDSCRVEKLSGYRQEIFDNPSYEASEPIEPEDY